MQGLDLQCDAARFAGLDLTGAIQPAAARNVDHTARV